MTNAELIARVRALERLRYGSTDERAEYCVKNGPTESCDLAVELADALEQVTQERDRAIGELEQLERIDHERFAASRKSEGF